MLKKKIILAFLTISSSWGLANDSTTQGETHHLELAADSVQRENKKLIECKSKDSRTKIRFQMLEDRVVTERRVIRSEKRSDAIDGEIIFNDYETLSPGSSLEIDGHLVTANLIGSELTASEFSPRTLSIYLNENESTPNLARYEANIMNLSDLVYFRDLSNESLDRRFGFSSIRERLARGDYLVHLTGYKQFDPTAGIGYHETSSEKFLMCTNSSLRSE